jgi:hypothetical protein
MGYPRPGGLFLFCAASGHGADAAASALLVRLGLFVDPFSLRFGFLQSIEQVKGWRHFFQIANGVFLETLSVLFVRLHRQRA